MYYHSIDEDQEYHYYQAKATGTEIIEGATIGQLSLTDEDGNTYTATCEGEFNEHIVGPTTVTLDESGEEIVLYGNQMDYEEEDAIEGLDGAYRKVSATFMITQDEQLNIANIPVSTTYEITESRESGYEFLNIDANVSDVRKDGTKISGTIVPDSDTNITYTNRCLVTDISIQKVDTTGAGLEGAVFQLKTVSDDEGHEEAFAALIDTIGGIGDVVKEVNGTSTTFPSSFESTGGIQTLTGLPDGTYRLYELYIPAGYISTYRYIQFKIENRVMKDVTTDTEDISNLDTTVNNIDLKITNIPGAALPNTGGPGTTLIYLLGIMLAGIAGAVLVMRKCRREA